MLNLTALGPSALCRGPGVEPLASLRGWGGRRFGR